MSKKSRKRPSSFLNLDIPESSGDYISFLSPSSKKIILSCPSVNSLSDLISIAEDTSSFYTNFNSLMLRRILPYIKELNSLIGLSDIKNSIFEQLLYFLQSMHSINKHDFLHTVITGPPGTGKTTIAKIIANIYKHSGILSPGSFTIAQRSDLIGGYLGQTALKTTALLNKCIGGVLFIDEIYSLGCGDKDRDMYSRECIDTINLFLSEHKNDFCLIIAGYENEINDRFFSINDGLHRRFPWVHSIKSYSSDDLADICLKLLHDSNWKTDISKSKLSSLISPHLSTIFKNFGGSIETWIAKTKLAHSRRVFSLDFSLKYILSFDDFSSSLSSLKKSLPSPPPPPLELYI